MQSLVLNINDIIKTDYIDETYSTRKIVNCSVLMSLFRFHMYAVDFAGCFMQKSFSAKTNIIIKTE